jgi:acetoacetyl-CoA synthetase
MGDFKSDADGLEIDFAQLPFDHPLYVMYSSGTTGLPKCMVQSAGGILIHHLKELMLHTDLKRDDTIFYFTTCGWMMWNWLVSAWPPGPPWCCMTAIRSTLPQGLVADGPGRKDHRFRHQRRLPGRLQAAGVRPREEFDLSPLRAVLSTGSPLSIESFEFVYDAIKSDLQLASIAGGTDLNGCFALGNPMGPVYAGELQCRGLAMKVFAFDEDGSPWWARKANWCVRRPFLPCRSTSGTIRTVKNTTMPISTFTRESGATAIYQGHRKRRGGDARPFRRHLEPGRRSHRHGRNLPAGRQLEEIADSVVVGQNWNNDVRVILFVVMADGVQLTQEIENKIRKTIRTHASPRHVPAKIIAVDDIPYTLNMKKVEVAVRKVIHGLEVKNKDALRNPQCLEAFASIKELNE